MSNGSPPSVTDRSPPDLSALEEAIAAVPFDKRPRHSPVRFGEIVLLRGTFRAHGWHLVSVDEPNLVTNDTNAQVSMTEVDASGNPFIGANDAEVTNVAPQPGVLAVRLYFGGVSSDVKLLINVVAVRRHS